MSKLAKRILSSVSALVLVLGLSSFVVAPSVSAQVDNRVTQQTCEGINAVLGGGLGDQNCETGEDADSTLANTVNDLINLFSLIVGAVSVIMIIYGGFKYITSGGSDDGTKGAKNTILYALVGLIIVLLSQTIVKFVFSKAVSVGEGGE